GELPGQLHTVEPRGRLLNARPKQIKVRQHKLRHIVCALLHPWTPPPPSTSPSQQAIQLAAFRRLTPDLQDALSQPIEALPDFARRRGTDQDLREFLFK